MRFGPDTHPTPLWDHPDYEHVGWADREDVSRGNRPELYDDVAGSDPLRDLPVFRPKNGRGMLAVHHEPEVGTDITHYPDDPSLNVTRWVAAETDSPSRALSLDVHTSVPTQGLLGLNTWTQTHRAGKSHPGVIRETLRALNLHHGSGAVVSNRKTGATAGKPNAFRRFDISKATADDIERFYLEVYE